MSADATQTVVTSSRVFGAVEAGGTKMIGAVGRTWEEIRDGEHVVVATTSTAATTAALREWFEARHDATPLSGIGVGSFGPLDVTRYTIGSTTPKVAWRGLNWRDALGDQLRAVPLNLDTDTNAALTAEWRWGAAKGLDVAAYVTVGTGIGGALLVNGHLVHGLQHPELGHLVVRREPHDVFPGVCPHHGDCLEGLASGTALTARWGDGASRLAPAHRAWELEASYLAQAVVSLVLVASPRAVIMGGGVLHHEGLRQRVDVLAREQLAGYLEPLVVAAGERYVLAPTLGDGAGVVGAFALALEADGLSR